MKKRNETRKKEEKCESFLFCQKHKKKEEEKIINVY